MLIKVITAIMHNCCPQDKPFINLAGKAKTGLTCWKCVDPHTGKDFPTPSFNMSESEVIFR